MSVTPATRQAAQRALARREHGCHDLLRDAEPIARAARETAARLAHGGTLICLGEGSAGAAAARMAAEFMHPTAPGRPPLPAMALYGGALPARLRMWARPQDVAVAVCPYGDGPAGDGRGPGTRHRHGGGVHDALAVAAEHGLLTVALTGPGAFTGHADHVITVRWDDPALAEELHLTVQHLLWELVHEFLDSAAPPGPPPDEIGRAHV